jgi:AraC-like DNA-binding protein
VYPNASESPSSALSRDCSIPARSTAKRAHDTILFQGKTTMVGQFCCGVNEPSFGNSGPIERAIVVFPRTSVWIEHEASRPFVADPNVVTIYNRGQRYQRRAISPQGDRCDWFAVCDELAREIVFAFDETAAESDTIFRFESTASAPALYLYQQCVSRAAAQGRSDALGTEERIIRVVSSVLSQAYGRVPSRLSRRAAATRRRRDLVEGAKAELLRGLTVNTSVHDVATALGVSPFHLCRVFRAHVGRTMHDYRNEARLRVALELIGAQSGRPSLSAIAHGAGFSSHSHFVTVCRKHLGETPRAIRQILNARAG